MKEMIAVYHSWPANARGAVFMLISAFCFTLMTSMVKFLGDGYGPALQTFYRQGAILLVMAPLILRNPKAALHTTRPGVVIFRAAAGTIAIILSFYTFQVMPLADANALTFTRTLWIVPLAAFLLGEKVGIYRITATLIGFAGVMIMLRPSGDLVSSLPALAGLASALLFAGTVAGMKVMTRDHSTFTLMTYSGILGFLMSIPFALMEWRWPSLWDLALLAIMGVLSLLAQSSYIKGISLGDAAAMATLDYTRLVFAVLTGFFIFHEIPDIVVMIGAAIVIGSTLFITVREARLAVRKPRPPAE